MQSIPPLRFDAAGRRDGRGLGVVWGRHYLSKLLVGLRAVLARPRLDAQIGFQFWFLATNHLYLHDSFFASLPHACDINALLGRTFADIEEEGRPEFVVYNVGVDADGLFIEYYSADLKGVPRAQKDRHWCHYEENKHWIQWVDDGLSERADVGPAKKRKLLPASLR